jgi:hypothetical protein
MSTLNTSSQPHSLVRFWKRIPLLPRAVIGGLFVFAALQFGWNALIAVNFQMSPGIPWNVPVGLLYLWVVSQFFNGPSFRSPC